MDCLLCYRVFIKEKEFVNYNQNPQICKKAILELFEISRNPDVQGLSGDLMICISCQLKLEQVEDLVDQFVELKRKMEEARIAIKKELVESKEASEAMAKNTAANRMSQSSMDRLILLKAIDGNTRPPGAENNQIEAGNSDESSEEEQDPATDGPQNNDTNGPPNERAGVLAIDVAKSKEDWICLDRVQNPPRVSTISQEEDPTPSQSKSKGGYDLRSPKPVAKTSNEGHGSDSEPGDDSEDYTDGESEPKRSRPSKRTQRSVLKEFTRLVDGSYRCKHCSMILIHLETFSKHLSIHCPQKIKCSECGKCFSFKITRDVHVKTVHEGRRDFQCTWEGCGKWFGEKSNMIKHVQGVHEGRKFKCSAKGCGKKLSTKQSRDGHVKNVHKMRGKQLRDIIVEAKMVHNEQRDFKCTWEECGKRFTRQTDLVSHIKIVHEKTKDYKCGVEGCGSAFAIKKYLQIHMARKHKRMSVAQKKRLDETEVISPQAGAIDREFQVNLFYCLKNTFCGRVYTSESARNAHEESAHIDN